MNLIASTTATTGLSIQAELDERTYEKDIKVSDEEIATLPIIRHDFMGSGIIHYSRGATIN